MINSNLGILKSLTLISFFSCILAADLHSIDRVDSLRKSLQLAEGTVKVDILNEIAFEYCESSPAISIKYGKDALELAQKLEYEWGEADALNYLAMGYDFLGEYEESMNYYLQSLAIFERINEYGVSTILNNIGTLYSQMGDYKKALEFYKESREYFGEDDAESMGVYLNNIAEIYSMMGDNKKSLELYFESKSYYETIQDTSGIATALNNIADVYKELGNFSEATIIGLQSRRLFEAIDEKIGEAYALLTLGEIYIDAKDYQKAVTTLNECLMIVEIAGTESLLASVYENYYKAHKGLKNYPSAFEFYHLYVNLNNKLMNQESKNKISMMQVLYESEKREKEIEVLGRREHQRTYQRNIMIVCFGALFIFTVVLYRSNQIKHKLNNELDKKNVELDKAIQEVKSLSGMLPICSHCKSIRDDKGYWSQVEDYISRHSEADFSHGICPACIKELYPELSNAKGQNISDES